MVQIRDCLHKTRDSFSRTSDGAYLYQSFIITIIIVNMVRTPHNMMAFGCGEEDVVRWKGCFASAGRYIDVST